MEVLQTFISGAILLMVFRGWEPTNSIEELAAIFSVFFLLVQGKR